MPCAFGTGLLGCLLMCLVLASAESFTLYVLSKMAERYNGKTYGTLVRKALGRKLSAGEVLHVRIHDVA